MEYLPLFANLTDRSVLVVGGGNIAARKIQLLRLAGARIQVVSEKLCLELQTLVDTGELEWLAASFDPVQIDSVFIVIAATDNNTLNSEVYTETTARLKLVNVVDDQSKCSFIFPAIIDRSPLVIAISSSGTAPILVRMLREKLETLLPAHLGQIAKLAGQWRDKVKHHFKRVLYRRRYWERIFNGRFVSQVAVGDLVAAKKTLDSELRDESSHQGEIILVGAGPGDSGLLTLRGLQVMQLADVVLYDYLVSHEVLNLVRRDADRICVGKRASIHTLPQDEINQMMVELARQGKCVVRLKGGDPFIFGRGAEELQAAQQAGIAFQIVPGVTAAAGATAYAGIPLTHRDYAQSVLFITGHCRSDSEGIDWSSLVRSRQTLAIYMGTVKAGEISEQLICHGCDASTPVAVIGCGTRKDQQVLIGILEQLEAMAVSAPPPAILVIGEVVNLHRQLSWFQNSAQHGTFKSAVINLI